jgi:hypothetical protein
MAALAVLLAGGAHAGQFTAAADVNGSGTSYVGPGYNFSTAGYSADGGHDAFDGYGYYSFDPGVLSLQRQTELLSGTNTYRFFDTFTNLTGLDLTTAVVFYGNLGSDSATQTYAAQPGLLVTCEGDASVCSTGGHDPIVASVAGNNGLAVQHLTTDNYTATFQLSFAPGQSLSLLNFAFLARDDGGVSNSDMALALTTGQSLLASPNLTGLTADQQGRIANWSATAAVPEPSSWAMMILGVAGLGATLRRRTAAMA